MLKIVWPTLTFFAFLCPDACAQYALAPHCHPLPSDKRADMDRLLNAGGKSAVHGRMWAQSALELNDNPEPFLISQVFYLKSKELTPLHAPIQVGVRILSPFLREPVYLGYEDHRNPRSEAQSETFVFIDFIAGEGDYQIDVVVWSAPGRAFHKTFHRTVRFFEPWSACRRIIHTGTIRPVPEHSGKFDVSLIGGIPPFEFNRRVTIVANVTPRIYFPRPRQSVPLPAPLLSEILMGTVDPASIPSPTVPAEAATHDRWLTELQMVAEVLRYIREFWPGSLTYLKILSLDEDRVLAEGSASEPDSAARIIQMVYEEFDSNPRRPVGPASAAGQRLAAELRKEISLCPRPEIVLFLSAPTKTAFSDRDDFSDLARSGMPFTYIRLAPADEKLPRKDAWQTFGVSIGGRAVGLSPKAIFPALSRPYRWTAPDPCIAPSP